MDRLASAAQRRPWLVFLGLLLVIHGPHLPHSTFVLDDWMHAAVYRRHAWTRIAVYALTHVQPTTHYRPVFTLVFSGLLKLMDFRMPLFRLGVLALSSINLHLLLGVLVRLGAPRCAAWAGVLLWMLHPLHLEGLLLASVSDTLLCMTFSLLALQAWLRFLSDPRRGKWGGSTVAWIALAIATYEAALFLGPLFVWIGRRGGDRQRMKRPLAVMGGVGLCLVALRTALRRISDINPRSGYHLEFGGGLLYNLRQAVLQLAAFHPSHHVQRFSGGQAVEGARWLPTPDWPTAALLHTGVVLAAIAVLAVAVGRGRAESSAPGKGGSGITGGLIACGGVLAFAPFLFLATEVSIGNRYFETAAVGAAGLLAWGFERVESSGSRLRITGRVLLSAAAIAMGMAQQSMLWLDWRPAWAAAHSLESDLLPRLSPWRGRAAVMNLVGFPRAFGSATLLYPEWGWQGWIGLHFPRESRWVGRMEASPEEAERESAAADWVDIRWSPLRGRVESVTPIRWSPEASK